uniref:Uncharacterized protein n=1 Tax=Rhizophora mucronata TaxID=61149 RepID=A0A2P2QGN5_RHIMU
MSISHHYLFVFPVYKISPSPAAVHC